MSGIPKKDLQRLSAPFSGVSSGEDLSQAFERLWSRGMITESGLQRLAKLDDRDNILVVAHPMDVVVPEHTHGYIEIAYVAGGRIINVIGGKERYMFADGVCVMCPGSAHALKPVDPSAVVVNVCISPRLFSDGIFREFLLDANFVSTFLRGEGTKPFLLLQPSIGDSYIGLVQQIMREFVEADGHQTFKLAGLVLALLGSFTQADAYGYHGADEATLAMLDYVRAHVSDVTTASLAHEFGFNKNYLSQYLMRRCGKGPSKFIQEERLRQARALLSQTDLAVSEVAHRVGYASASRLHALFKEAFGETPGEFRAQWHRVR